MHKLLAKEILAAFLVAMSNSSSETRAVQTRTRDCKFKQMLWQILPFAFTIVTGITVAIGMMKRN